MNTLTRELKQKCNRKFSKTKTETRENFFDN